MENIAQLTSSQKKQSRKNFNIFQAFNGASFSLLNGSIITLFAIRLGANSSFIGLISSFNYMAYILVYCGRILEPRMGVVQLYFWTWFLRNIFMLPILAIPVMMIWERSSLSLSLLLFGSIGFNLARGPGMGANNTMASMLSTPKNQTSYLSLIFMLNFGTMIISTILIGIALKFSTSITTYTLLLLLGIILGFISSYYLFLIPNIAKSKNSISYIKFLQGIFSRPAFRIFALVFFLISFVTAATRPFLIVYMRSVYHQNDSSTILFTVSGFIGAFLMSAFSKTIVQTVGAKTLFIFFSTLSTLSLVPAILSPELNGIYMVVFLVLFNFIAIFGLQGIESTGQTYLLGIIRRSETMDAFILFFIIFGLGGGLGSFVGGKLLNTLQSGIPNIRLSFQIFFGIALLLMFTLLILMGSLKNTNKTSVRTGLSFIINPKDIQAISLANRLEAAPPSEIKNILSQISRLESDAAIEIIIESLQSPQLDIRRQALFTLESISGSDQPPELIRALLQQLRSYPFTTAHMAARILGKHHITQAIPSLRKAMSSSDYRLKAEAITALGLLQDTNSIPLIKRHIYKDNNPYVLISALHSLQLLISVRDIYVLFWPLTWQKVNNYIIDESILLACVLVGMLDYFYHRYLLFLNNSDEAYSELKDFIQSSKKIKANIKQILDQLISHHFSQINFIKKIPTIFTLISNKNNFLLQEGLQHICHNPVLTRYSSLRFFVLSTIAWELEKEQ